MDQVTLIKPDFRMRRLTGHIQSSGRTVASWWEENGINIKTYYYWLRKLRLRAMKQ